PQIWQHRDRLPPLWARQAEELERVRPEFAQRASTALIKQLVDDLLSDKVLNDGEGESILEENPTRADKARCLIDTVRKKGNEASKKMIAHIHKRDSSLHTELGL
uniref:Caspase-1-like n=1 Tax=Echeneis naucrates TaxID=173247 RepID=A0A665UAA2_ECHNA